MIKEFETFIINFTQPFHLSDSKEEYSNSEKIIRSDTLYAAIIDIMAHEKDNEITIDFALSSVYPCLKNNDKYEYFLPILRLPKIGDTNLEIKKIKKVQYLHKSIYEKQLLGEEIFSGNKDIVIEKEFAIYSKDLPENILNNPNFKQEKEKIFSYCSSQVVQRAKVPRYKGDTEPFYFDKIYINNQYWNLYLIATGNTNKVKKYLEKLGEQGLGSDRTYGYGQFEIVKKDSVRINLPDTETVYFTNISVFVPSSENDVDISKSYYSISNRTGYITTFPYNTFRKKSINVIDEGSVIYFNKLPDGFINGNDKIDLTPDILKGKHEVLRCGKSIFLPVKLID